MSEERNVLLKDSFVLKFKNARDLGIIYRIDYRKNTFLSIFFFSYEINVKERKYRYFSYQRENM